MVILIRFVKNITILGFIILLGLAYYELSDRSAEVVVYRDAAKNPALSTSSNVFFYIASILFIVSNILISVLVKVVRGLPLHKFNLPNQDFWSANRERIEILHDIFTSWIYILALIINSLIIACVLKIWFTNRGMGGQLYEYGLLALAFLIAIGFWIGFIFYRLKIKREEFIT